MTPTSDALASDAALEAHGIHHHYRRSSTRPFRVGERVDVLDGVDLRLTTGDAVGIVGRSGSGKSTLLRILLGLEQPIDGVVTVGGEPLPARRGRRALAAFRRHVQYIPQDPASSLDPRMTVFQLVVDPLRRLRVPGDHRDRVNQALASVRLGEEFLGRRPGGLSGGQAQRVAIARALATGARIVLADEPVSGLDRSLRDETLDLFADIVAEQGIGIALVSHDLDAVARLCRRTVVLADGRIVESGDTAALIDDPQHDATRLLVSSRPHLRLPLRDPS